MSSSLTLAISSSSSEESEARLRFPSLFGVWVAGDLLEVVLGAAGDLLGAVLGAAADLPGVVLGAAAALDPEAPFGVPFLAAALPSFSLPMCSLIALAVG